MNARVTELLSVVYEPLAKAGYLGRLGKGIFLTGGSSLMKGIGEVAEEIFGIRSKREAPKPCPGPPPCSKIHNMPHPWG